MQNLDSSTSEFQYLSRMLRAFVTFEDQWKAATAGDATSKITGCPELAEKAAEMNTFLHRLDLAEDDAEQLAAMVVGLICEAERQGIRVGFDVGLTTKTALDRLRLAAIERREENE